jgi:protein tyrosine phosphatase
MVCHVSGVPSDTMVTYQWSCPNYGCGARGLQSDGNIVSRREEGNMIAIDVVNGTDSGDYTCNVRNSGEVLGTATYRINSVKAGLVLTGKTGMIPLDSSFTSNSSILSPFEGAAGEYIRCGSTGGQPGWYNEADVLVPMLNGSAKNIYFHSAPNIGELWFDTMTRSTINREFRCSPQNGSLTSMSSFIGLFFLNQTKLNGTPRPKITSQTTNSVTLSWSPVTSKSNGYHVSYRREDLSISLPPTYIRFRNTSITQSETRSVTLQDLEPGASYRIHVWDFQYICCTDHNVSSPCEMTVTTTESAPTAPRLLTVVRSTSTSVDLNWIPPRHPNGVIHYEIEYSTNKSFVDSTTINTESNSTYHTVSDVPEFPRYYFRVVAVNNAGVGRALSSNIVDVCLGMNMCMSASETAETTQSPPDDAGLVVGAVVVVILLVIAITIAVVVIVILFLRYRKRSESDSQQRYTLPQEEKSAPLPHPTLSKLKLQDDLSSSADCLLEHQDGGNPQAGLSTPVISQKISKPAESVSPPPKPPIKPASRASRPASTEEFLDIIEIMHHKGKTAFSEEFNSLETQTADSVSIGTMNKAKNRYKNIFPYDHSRVVLSVKDGKGSDYINASYVDGYKMYNHYVAAQGPTPQTLQDFCQMVWDAKFPMIVMVTKLMEGAKSKCEQYYPENAGETLSFGPYTLRTKNVRHFVDFEVRAIELSSEESDTTHSFDHYLFTGWPDYGVPKYPTSLIRMLYHVREHRISDIPIIVHCSAGVGRTGTFIALDCILDQINAENTIDIKRVVKKMREKRMFMVQTVDQYTFLHTAVRELLLCGDTSVRSTDLRRFISKSKESGFKHQFELLDHLTADSVDSKKVTEQMDKVRYMDRLPVQGKHVYVPTAAGTVFYNASHVDGYHAPKAFIAAQSPMSNTVGEFWSMIVDKKVATVVLLCPLWENGKEGSSLFWPKEENAGATYEGTDVTTDSVDAGEVYDEYKLTVQQDQRKCMEVTLYHYKQWFETKTPDLVSLLKFLVAVQNARQQNSTQPIVISCNDGLGRSCTFIAIWSLLEQMKAEGQIDVLSTVKSIRTQRPGGVNNLSYYISCYDAVLAYLDSFAEYSNVPY